MQNEIQAISYMLKQSSGSRRLPSFGSLGVLYIHVQFKMVRAGYKTLFDVMREPPVRTVGKRTPSISRFAPNTWSPWPVYLFLPCLLAGIGCWYLDYFASSLSDLRR